MVKCTRNNEKLKSLYNKYRISEAVNSVDEIINKKIKVLKPKDPTVFILLDFIHIIDTIRFWAKDKLELLNVSVLKKIIFYTM